MSLSRTKTWIAGEVLSASDLNSEFNNPLTLLSTGTANTKLFTNAGATAAEWASGLKIGTTTRDISTATGTQAITGVGFKPSAIIFLAVVNGSVQGSIGLDNATTSAGIYNTQWFSAGTWGSTATALRLTVDGNGIASGIIQSFDADGFTISWTKTNSPTGTAAITYLAIR